MAYKLENPTEDEKIKFIVEFNHNLGLNIAENETTILALMKNEIMQDGVPVIDPNYNEKEIVNQTQKEIKEIESLLQELDIKRIRAICEPSLKNENTGQTWLDYYNSQILSLREQIQQLKGRISNDITI